MNEFSLHLKNKKKSNRKGEPMEETLSFQTINRILGYGTVALSWSKKRGIIQDDPSEGLSKFTGKQKKRGILSDKEVDKLFNKGDWRGNEGARLGNLLASQTGMRAGEIIALQVRDILDDRINVIHSYSRTEGGLKSTKTREERKVPILPETRKLLIDYAKMNPAGYGPDSFIFFSHEKKGVPQGTEVMLSRLKYALDSIGINYDEQSARGLTYHSWRHFYARKMVDVLGERTAKLTGHATKEMLDHYSNHANEEDFQKAVEATAEVFGKVIPFNQEAAK
jgi:integrase